MARRLTEEDLLKKLTTEKNQAYLERNELVSFVSRLYDSHLCKHPLEDKEWAQDWRWIVCIHSPNGQLTFHVHDTEVYKFKHLALADNHWDGHTTDEKYNRLRRLPLT